MIVKGADIIGAKIVTDKEKKEIGQVLDIIYDPIKNKVEALLLTPGDVLTEAQVIPLREILEATTETITIKSESSLKPVSKTIKPASTPSGDDDVLHNEEIKKQDGTVLGKFNDLYFDTSTGQVAEYEVIKDQVPQKIKVKEVVASTQNETVIKDASEEKSGIMDKVKDLLGQ